MRVLVGSDNVIVSPTFVAADEVTPAATTGTPVASVTRADGTVITAPTVTAGVGTGVYEFTLTAAQTATLDVLSVVWTGTVAAMVQRYDQRVEVCGGHYVTLAELRSMAGLDNATFTVDRLKAARDDFVDVAERYLGVAYVPRYEYETIRSGYGWGSTGVKLSRLYPRTIRSLSFGGVVETDLSRLRFTISGDLDWSWGTFSAPLVNLPSDVVVGYEHGLDGAPEPLRNACREYVRSSLLKSVSGMSRDVLTQSMGDGTYTRYMTPDFRAGRPTGWGDVDRELNSLSRDRVPGSA